MALAMKAFVQVFDEGTEITIERVNQFMHTPAGKATVFFVGWKILAKDVLSTGGEVAQTIIGILLIIPYIFFLKFIYRYFVTGKNAIKTQDGKAKTYEWLPAPAMKLGDDAYGFWCGFSTVAISVFTIVIVILIF